MAAMWLPMQTSMRTAWTAPWPVATRIWRAAQWSGSGKRSSCEAEGLLKFFVEKDMKVSEDM